MLSELCSCPFSIVVCLMCFQQLSSPQQPLVQLIYVVEAAISKQTEVMPCEIPARLVIIGKDNVFGIGTINPFTLYQALLAIFVSLLPYLLRHQKHVQSHLTYDLFHIVSSLFRSSCSINLFNHSYLHSNIIIHHTSQLAIFQLVITYAEQTMSIRMNNQLLLTQKHIKSYIFFTTAREMAFHSRMVTRYLYRIEEE